MSHLLTWRRQGSVTTPCEGTYTELRDRDVQHTPHDDQSIKGVPGIDEVMLREDKWAKWQSAKKNWSSCKRWFWKISDPHVSPQSQELDDHLYGEDHGEDHVEDVHDGGERLRLLVMLRGQKRSNHHNTEMDEFLCVCVCVCSEPWRVCEALPEQPEWGCFPESAQTWCIQTDWSWLFSRIWAGRGFWGCKSW